MKKIAIYVRCSTQDQNPEMQWHDLNGYAEARGWRVFRKYEDQRTGTNDKRPELQQMLKDARARKFDVLLCWKLDRVFRSFPDLVNTLQLLGELGVEFVSFKDAGIDMTTASGRLLTHILAAFAEFEASIIKERVRAGVQNKIRKTGKWGPEKRIDEDAILRLREEGKSLREIAFALGISKTAVQRVVARGSKHPEKADKKTQ